MQKRNSQSRYFEEFERFKDVPLQVGNLYRAKAGGKLMMLIEYSFDENFAVLQNVDDEHTKRKTGHWARKNLDTVE